MRALIGLALVAVAAGGGCRETPAGRRPLVYYERSDPRSLDPALATDVPTGEMVALVFDGLTGFDADGHLHPALADRWTVGADGRHYLFHLRAGVKFHDGTPLTAAVVRASLVRVLSPATRGGRVWPLYPIAGAEEYAAGRAPDVRGLHVVGDTAIAFELERPLAIFPTFLAMPVASILPAGAPADFGAHPVGSGPWRFLAWQHDDYLRFARNAAYWAGPPRADTLTVRILPEALTRAAEFETGGLSVIEVPFGESARWRRDHPAWLVEKPALRVVYVALNTRRGPLQDVRVRQAINWAVNVPEMLATVYDGRGIAARGAIPPALDGSDTTRAGYRFDPVLARRLLAQAGYASGIDLELWRTAANAELSRVAQAIQAQLAEVGIRVALIERDPASEREAARQGRADMVVLDWWADYPDADNFLYPLFYSGSLGAGGNYAFYTDRVVDSLILLARRTTDAGRRAGLYRAIDGRVYRAAPWLYLWFPKDLWARRPEATGWDVPVIFNGQRWTMVQGERR